MDECLNFQVIRTRGMGIKLFSHCV